MTAIDLSALEALLAAATPGPWERHTIEDPDAPFSFLAQANAGLPPGQLRIVGESYDDHAFICAATNQLPALIARIRELEAGAAEHEEELLVIARNLDAAIGRAHELEAENRWIPVGERLPECDEHVLFIAEDEGMSYGYRTEFGWCIAYNYEDAGIYSTVTHWRELPRGP